MILVWQIDSFNSDLAPPDEEAHQVTVQTPTVSSFGGKFQRLQTLQLPDDGPPLRNHFALVGSYEPVVMYADAAGIYSWNLAQAAAKTGWDNFEAAEAENTALWKGLMEEAPWAWEEALHIAVGNGGMYLGIGMRDGRLCLLLFKGETRRK
jgi:hypothetical protein